jgi:glycosyltransferase involved in cell wall biosynthesis
MSAAPPDVTVIVTAHREGPLAADSLRSAEAAVKMAAKQGISTEVIAILDRCDQLTMDVFRQSCSTCNVGIHSVDYGDPGLSRNHGVQAARGRFIAFLDADDLWSPNWIAAAFQAAKRDSRDIVWHPEFNIYFGDQPYRFRHVDMEDPEFDIKSLFVSNYWTALSFAPRELLQRVPYPRLEVEAGFGFEDWRWNHIVIDHGAIHKVVRDSAHAIRQKPRSLMKTISMAQVVPGTSDLIRNYVRSRRNSARVTSCVPPR